LTKNIHNERTQLHVIASILTATDKVIDEQYAQKIKEWIKMNKVMRLLVEEFEQEKEVYEKTLEIAKNLLDVLPIHEIAKRIGLTISEVADLAKEIEK